MKLLTAEHESHHTASNHGAYHAKILSPEAGTNSHLKANMRIRECKEGLSPSQFLLSAPRNFQGKR